MTRSEQARAQAEYEMHIMRCALKERNGTLAALREQKATAPTQIADVQRDIQFIRLKLARMNQRWNPKPQTL